MNYEDYIDPADIPRIDLAGVTIHKSIIDLVPESIARENAVIPLAYENGAMRIVTRDPTDFDLMQKLLFILNMNELHPVLSSREQIVDAINRHYGH